MSPPAASVSDTTFANIDHGVEVATGFGVLVGSLHQLPGAREPVPQRAERVLHAHAGEERRLGQGLARHLDAVEFFGGESFVHVERVGDRAGVGAGGTKQTTSDGGGEPDHVGGHELFHQFLTLGGVGHQPAQREDVGTRGGLGGEREPAFGDRTWDARVPERPEQPTEYRTLAPHDHGHVRPAHAFLDVQAAQLSSDRGVFLGRMRCDPRPPLHRLAVGPVVRLEGDRGRAVERLGGEPVERHPGGSLEREDVGLGVGRHDEVGRAQPADDRFAGQRGVLIVVDEHMVEQRRALARRGGRALDQSGEVDHPQVVHHGLVFPEEPGELMPAGEAAPVGGGHDVVGRPQSFLRPQQELADLVGEPAQPQQGSVGGPGLGILIGEQLLHPRELLGRRQDLRRLVSGGLQPVLQHAVGETVQGDHVEARQRGGQSGVEGGAGRALVTPTTRGPTPPARGRPRLRSGPRTVPGGWPISRCPGRRRPGGRLRRAGAR